MVFSDGRYIGAILDRNGLRPARYYSTTDGMIYMSSEVGVVDLPDAVGVKAKGRLKPGRLLIVDTQAGDLLNDEELKQQIASRYPIKEWVSQGVSANPSPAPLFFPINWVSFYRGDRSLTWR